MAVLTPAIIASITGIVSGILITISQNKAYKYWNSRRNSSDTDEFSVQTAIIYDCEIIGITFIGIIISILANIISESNTPIVLYFITLTTSIAVSTFVFVAKENFDNKQ